MQVAADRLRKGQRKMRALAAAIRRFDNECAHARGSVAPGPTLEMEHIDPAINALDEALVAIRTLDLEVLDKSDSATYQALRRGSAQGMTVRGLTAPRNNAVHDAEVIDPDLPRAIGPLDDQRFIVFPRWKKRSSLPVAMFQYPDGPKQGQDRVALVASYDSAVAGRLVLDTLMDAFAFFDGCDPNLAERDDSGQLRGFPLAPLPIAGYHRLHPIWLDHDTVDRNIRQQVSDEAPAGLEREIAGRLTSTAGAVFCGYTNLAEGHRHSFTESITQVRRDIERGYSYCIRSVGIQDKVTIEGSGLRVGREALEQVVLPDWTGRDDEPWGGWWELCVSDATYYQRQRRAT